MDLVELIGRVLFAALFALNGLNHVRNREGMVGYGRMIGAPSPELSVPGTGVLMLFSAVTIALGFWADLGALLLVVFLTAAAFVAHRYWEEQDPMNRAAQEAHFWKNIALAGAALFIFWAFQQSGGDLPLTVGKSLF
jgi:putative oxidoreductase